MTREPPLVPQIDGYMSKLKHHRPRFFSAWNLRFFRTRQLADGSGCIEYFASKHNAEAGHKPKFIISMSMITSVIQFDELSFQINAGNQGTFLLRTESSAQYACWIQPLQQYIRDWSDFRIAVSYESTQSVPKM